MMSLYKNIENSIFGKTPTSDLLEEAFQIKKYIFGDKITYSPKVFIPLTTMCRDKCSYCTFVKSPSEGGTFLTEDEVSAIVSAGSEAGCYEALFTLGDKPENRWENAKTQLYEFGFSSTHEYLTYCMSLVNTNFQLFPHANPGLMSSDEIVDFKRVSPSGGLMIESFSQNLFSKGMPHFATVTKSPELRIATLENAKENKYPMTTGLLLGLTNSKEELVEDIAQLIKLIENNIAIQEIILQNFRAKLNTRMKFNAEITNDLFLRIIATTRIFAPKHISLQVPPNLSPDINKYLKSGINDLGGISPLTIDWVNPDHLWPNLDNLKNSVETSGQKLIKRLPVYPDFIKKDWINEEILEKINNIIDTDGYPINNE